VDRLEVVDRQVIARTCAIAGQAVRMSYDSQLEPLVQPLAQHSDSGGPPALVITLVVGELPVVCRTSIRSSADGRMLTFTQPGAQLALDRDSADIRGVVALEQLPGWERVKPLSLPLSVWATDRGLLALHAGAVSRNGRAALFAGPSGSGKSTCALVCAAAGFDFLSDDLVLAEPGQPWRVWSLYGSAALAPPTPRTSGDGAGRAEALRCASTAVTTPAKELVAAGGSVIRAVAQHAEPVVLLLPRLTDAPATRVRPASRAEALARLAPSSVLRRAVPAERNLRHIAQLVASLPVYWLDMRHGPGDIPDVVDAVLGSRLHP
jgi:hypothetical protein